MGWIFQSTIAQAARIKDLVMEVTQEHLFWKNISDIMLVIKCKILKREELDKRRLTEETYILGPEQIGKLFEEDISRFRDQESFRWILDKLNDWGFHHHIDEKKHSFIMEYSRYTLYADPRQADC